MGKKINPRIFRVRTTTKHSSRWFAKKIDFSRMLKEDVKLRKFIRAKIVDGGLSDILIERATGQININIYTSKPGVIIGKGGVGIEDMKKEIKKKFFGHQKVRVNINIKEVDQPDLNSELVVQQIKVQLEKRVPFRRAMKRAVETVRRAGGKGVKVIVAGRLNGAEIARTEKLSEGAMPLSSLRANIDYSRGAAQTIYGLIGIKVWIYKGNIFKKDQKRQEIKEENKAKRAARPKRVKKRVTKK